MQSTASEVGPPVRPLAVLALAAACLWILTGALFKLLEGSPALLPAFMHDLPVSVEVIYPLVIGIELGIVTMALLRPRVGWTLVALQYVAFFAVLGIQIARGETSCGCMGGNVEIAPTTMLAVDGVIFAFLMGTRPWSGLGRFGLPLPVAAAVAVAVFVLPRFVGRGQEVDLDLVRERLAASQAQSAGGSASNSAGSGVEAPAVDGGAGQGAGAGSPAGAGAGAEHGDGSGGAGEPATTTEGGSDASTTDPPPQESLGWQILDIEEWVGMDVFSTELAAYMDVGQLPLDGTWVFYRTTCDHCARHMLDLMNAGPGTPYGLIRIPEPGDNDDNRVVHLFPEGVHAELPLIVEYVLNTPAEIEVVGGVITAAREGV